MRDAHLRRIWAGCFLAGLLAPACGESAQVSSPAVARSASEPPHPWETDDAPADEMDWKRIDWDRLFESQRRLALGEYVPALEALELAASSGALGASERQLVAIYRGFALDKLGRSTEARDAYRAATEVHPHELALQGERGSIGSIRHIEKLRAELPALGAISRGSLDVDGVRISYTAAVPPAGAPRPVVIRVGHPHDGQRSIRSLRALRAAGVPDDFVLVETSTLRAVLAGRRLPVDAPELVARVPPLFEGFVRELPQHLPIDPKRIYLTGFSFDAVWAWILGYSKPESYAGVVALSAVSYPAPISAGLERGRDLPVCVLRGELDHQYPGRLEQERAVGARLMAVNPRSYFEVLPGVSHTGVPAYAWRCFQRILRGAS